MYKESKDKLKKSTLVISTVAILLMVTITSAPTLSSSAFDLGLISKDNNIGSIDTSSLFNCVGAAITCDNDNTVNNEVAINNGTNGGGNGPGTLFVDKEIRCVSTDGTPSNDEVCEFAESLSSFPSEDEFEFTITGDNPDPSQFIGSSTGTTVTIRAGAYEISETNNIELGQLTFLAGALSISTDSIDISPSGSVGDCVYTGSTDFDSTVATGSMTEGESLECTIINTVTIDGGTVPTGGPEI